MAFVPVPKDLTAVYEKNGLPPRRKAVPTIPMAATVTLLAHRKAASRNDDLTCAD